ncbi:MAG: ferritin-like domain-containing protein [Deltaproteobacteria bacterium]|nr:ferritin-like domain-containing protein [Deltaproteobacteria bacterium]MBK8716304.1 ferritin-like domain-containing protein [Deltaproteobacteria bacterium]MBP7291300.1 ferritin-like domain-containing protein [Nannocystaceae bacterium]
MARTHLPHLASLVAAVLADGCCGGLETVETTVTTEHQGTLTAAQVQQVREAELDDDARCEAACHLLFDVDDDYGTYITACSTGDPDEVVDPWSPEKTAVTVSCRVESIESQQVEPTCGRRPQGHRAATVAGDGRGRWFALAAHLEAASVQAFEELARALARHRAPVGLRSRCVAAARDERRHAHAMARLAAREGATVPRCEAGPCHDDLFAVALHNAVEGCVDEAFAAVLAAAQVQALTDVQLRRVFATIADDECRHGQLAFDVHAWLLARLPSDQRAQVEAARAQALASLPTRAAAAAAATPPGLGWPSPRRAAAMARRFAALLGATQSPKRRTNHAEIAEV